MSADLLAEFGQPAPATRPSGQSSQHPKSPFFNEDIDFFSSGNALYKKPNTTSPAAPAASWQTPAHQEFDLPLNPDSDVLFDAAFDTPANDDDDDWDSFSLQDSAPISKHQDNHLKVDSNKEQTTWDDESFGDWGEFTDAPVSRPCPKIMETKEKPSQQVRPSRTIPSKPTASTWDDDAFDDWDDFTDGPSAKPVPEPILISSPTPSNAAPAATVRPTNIPPPSVLLELFLEVFESLQKEAALAKSQLRSSKNVSPTALKIHNLLQSAARVIAGRSLRWKRDTILSQSMRIGPARSGKAGGMKLNSVNKQENIKEEQDAVDVITTWRERAASFNAVLQAAGQRPIPPVSDPSALKVITARADQGALKAPHPCALCSLKRDERVLRVDEQSVQDSFGECKRKLSCVFNDRDQKILVTRGYILELQQKIARIEQNEKGQASPFSSSFDTQTIDLKDREDVPTLERTSTPEDHGESHDLEDQDSGLANPLSTGPPAFMSAANGRTFYLGTSSNWSFTRRVLSLAHQHLYHDVLPTETLLFDETTYELGWNGLRTTPNPDIPVVPTRDHTMYLINAVKFRCGQLYHLFEEDVFMNSLHHFYSGEGHSMTDSLWYIHFLLILAFGKGFVQPKVHGKGPPGVGYFIKALQLLPDPSALYRDPMIGTEILCCIALYYQCVDFRTSAYNFIGQAVRIAMAQGMHTRMPVESLGHDMVQRSSKIWWTVYILDREMTSLMGLPQSINDRYVQTQLPTFSDPSETMSLGMHIKLSQIIAEINSTIYVINGRINRTFLLSTKTALANIAGLADELRESFPLYLDPASGVSRTSAYLHLQYHQCIILATRPLLFCLLKIRFESPESCLESIDASRNVRSLIQMCLESAQHIIYILSSLQSQGLLETFLPFDLESIFVSTVILLMGPAIHPRLLESHPNCLERAYAIFEEMIRDGSQVASYRRSELQQLDETLLGCISGQPRPLAVPPFLHEDVLPRPASPSATPIPTMPRYDDALFRPDADLDVECDLSAMLTSAEIMAVADSIESYDTEWVSNAMLEHSIW
ncbi:hypothetical protein N7457_009158 [Penicillium paradoxum]|uniref:uncharacterized protein n=1 Tax=Penicillium paradoxum TaxID=176176 RepID=UPI002547DFFC|nr:uncharacterized protein N7457_009158 [Penicillium paradoxum]KAJ5774262.1 hypothetical protein N7457_009158 [Penicillium paradoxum]